MPLTVNITKNHIFFSSPKGKSEANGLIIRQTLRRCIIVSSQQVSETHLNLHNSADLLHISTQYCISTLFHVGSSMLEQVDIIFLFTFICVRSISNNSYLNIRVIFLLACSEIFIEKHLHNQSCRSWWGWHNPFLRGYSSPHKSPVQSHQKHHNLLKKCNLTITVQNHWHIQLNFLRNFKILLFYYLLNKCICLLLFINIKK